MRKPLWFLALWFLWWCELLFLPALIVAGVVWLATPVIPDVWWFVASCALTAAGAGWFTIRMARDNPPWPRCFACEYDLTGLPAHTPHCPECGFPIEHSATSAG